MHTLYIFRAESRHHIPHGKDSNPLIQSCARDFIQSAGIQDEEMDLSVHRTPEGKPEFLSAPLYFSISHSGNFWYCLISQTPCGLDVQKNEDRDFQRIARRFFRPEEQKKVIEGGREAFFRIWTRKESLGKLLGRGMFQAFPIPVLSDSEEYAFQNVEIPGFRGDCAFCFRSREEADLPAGIKSVGRTGQCMQTIETRG
ncbi:MAG: 4'-phosphopantetheinyl transferase family protein [Eubacterium sp.]